MESYHVKIITENGANFTNIDEARNYWFNSGMRDGISKGILNEGVFTTLESNVLYFDTCELRVGGHRFLLDQAYQYSFSSYPAVATRYALVATVVVDGVGNVTFTLGIQDAGISLVKDKLYKNLNGAGTYQVEIGRFTLNTDGNIIDVTRTLDIITGSKGEDLDGTINIGVVTTNTLEPEMDAEADVEQRYDAEQGKVLTDFTFSIPRGKGLENLDTELSESSTNAVQNNVITSAINKKADADNVYTKTETNDLLNVKLEYKGFAVGSLNNFKNCGIYNYNQVTTDIPSNIFGWGVLIVVNGTGRSDDYWVQQILIANTGTPRMAIRSFIDAWGNWYTL